MNFQHPHSYVRQLVRHYLSTANMHTFDAALPSGWLAVAGSGTGTDPFVGERILAAAAFHEQHEGSHHAQWLAISDSATYLTGWSSCAGVYNTRLGSIAHTELLSTGGRTNTWDHAITLTGQGRKLHFAFGHFTQALSAFYDELVKLPIQERSPRHVPFSFPSPKDAFGFGTARANLWVSGDEVTISMLNAIESLAHSGMDAGVVANLLYRIILEHRIRFGGAASHAGLWVSPMSCHDLGHTLIRLFKAPIDHRRTQDGHDQLTFVLRPDTDELIDNVAASMGAVQILNPITALHPTALAKAAGPNRMIARRLQAVFSDTGACSGYQLLTDVPDARLLAHVHLTLASLAPTVLDRRIRFGVQAPYDALFKREVGPGKPPPMDPVWQPFRELVAGGVIDRSGNHECVAYFALEHYSALRERCEDWFAHHGWRLIDGSTVDTNVVATKLRGLGFVDATNLARISPVFRASFQRDQLIVSAGVDTHDGKVRLRLQRL